MFLILVKVSIAAIEVNCEFKSNSEECKVNTLKVAARDMEVTSISGQHGYRKSNDDVKELWIVRTVLTEFVPTKFCKFFENLERIDIYGTSIKYISRKVFFNCVKVTKLCIMFTALNSIGEDVFEDLTELKELFIYDNKLVMLPGGLIAKNTNLTSFSAKNNLLQIIDIQFPTRMTKIDLEENNCIDKRFPETISVRTLNKEIAENCQSPMNKALAAANNKIKQIEETLKIKQTKIDEMSDELKISKATCETNISRLSFQNTMIKNENENHIRELKAISLNSTEKIAMIFEENVGLKTNMIPTAYRES